MLLYMSDYIFANVKISAFHQFVIGQSEKYVIVVVHVTGKEQDLHWIF